MENFSKLDEWIMSQKTKETKTTAKMGSYAQKSEIFLWKLVVSKAIKLSIKLIGEKISLYSIRRKDWLAFTSN